MPDFFAKHYDGSVYKTYLCVTACIPDATAGAGSDQAERSQPNSTGSNRTKEKAENGLSC